MKTPKYPTEWEFNRIPHDVKMAQVDRKVVQLVTEGNLVLGGVYKSHISKKALEEIESDNKDSDRMIIDHFKPTVAECIRYQIPF